MAKTLTIAGSNFLPQYQTNSAQIREIVQNKSNVMTMQIVVKAGQTTPREGSEIVFKDGSRFLFAGYITRIRPEEVGEGSFFIYTVEASDYSWLFNNKIARRAYENETLFDIVNDLLTTYVDSSYGFTTSNVATGPTIPSITFDHISVRKCLEKLQKLTGYNWFVDYQKNLYFQAATADPAPETITDSSDNFTDISIAYDTSQVRNSVIVIGSSDGQQSESLFQEAFVGDGETRGWELQDAPSEVVSITVNAVSKQFSLDVNERDTDDFVYSFTGHSFRQTDAGVTYTALDTIVISYYPRVPIIVQKQDVDSIAFFAGKDGGDGIYEYTLKEEAVSSKAEALERAQQELDEFAMPLVNGQFTTRTSLLDPGSIFAPGQYLTVNLPTYDIDDDTAFLIQEVNINLLETSSTTTEYEYTVRFGGKLVGVREFLESLASETSEVQDATEILTLEHASDALEIEDTTPTRTNITPPFKWGSGSPQGKWGLSEWS
jgi:hypothetical protein